MAGNVNNQTGDRGDPLDALLAQARWPEPRRGAMERLQQRILRHSVSNRRLRWLAISAIAASIAVFVTALTIPTNRIQETESPPIIPHVSSLQSAGPLTTTSHPPTLSEQLMLVALSQHGQPQNRTTATLSAATAGNLSPTASAVDRPPLRAEAKTTLRDLRTAMLHPVSWPDVPDQIQRADINDLLELTRETSLSIWKQPIAEELLRRPNGAGVGALLSMLCDAESRPAATAALRWSKNPPIGALIAQFDNPLIENRMAAAHALGLSCSHLVADNLIQMAQNSLHRREALAALLECHDASAVEFLTIYRKIPTGGPSHESEIQGIRLQLAAGGS